MNTTLVARIEQVCCLGLEEQVFIPARSVSKQRKKTAGMPRPFRRAWHAQRDAGAISIGRTPRIQYQEPLPLKVMRLARKLALTPKQVQVCSLLAAGYSYEKIAQHQQVSAHTVTDHMRKLFAKLAVTNRSELVAKLLSE